MSECRECGGTFSGYELCHECDTSDARITDLERQLAEAQTRNAEHSQRLFGAGKQLTAALDRLRDVDLGLEKLYQRKAITSCELEWLRGNRPTLTDGLGGLHDDQPHVLPSDLWQEIASLRADKERLDWLEQDAIKHATFTPDTVYPLSVYTFRVVRNEMNQKHCTLREAIDAAKSAS